MSEKEKTDLSKSTPFELKTQEIEVQGHKFKIRQFNFTERNKVESAQFDVQMIKGNPIFSYTKDRSKDLAIRLGIVEAPFDLKELNEVIKTSPGFIFDEVYDEIMKFNKMSEKKSES